MAGTQGYMVQPDPASAPFPVAGTSAPGPADNTAFTEGTTPATPIAVEYQDAGTDLTAGRSGVVRGTAKRAAHVNLRTAAGVELGGTAAPVNVSANPGQKASYSIVSALTTAAAPGDLWILKGSATKTIRIQRILMSGSATANSLIEMTLERRSADDTLGTSAALTPRLLDTADAAATLTARHYSANPTPGALVGNIRYQRALIGAQATYPHIVIDWRWDQPGQKQPTLSGVNDYFALSFNGGAFVGGVWGTVIEFTEE